MKRIIVIAMALIMVAMFAACNAGEPESTAETTPEPTATLTPTPEPVQLEVVPAVTPEQPVSYTTGLPYDGDYQPVMAVIENSAVARPQTGLQTADVVYEVPVEGGITRFVCVFCDNVPSEVMPVRSARPPFLYIQSEWDAVFMHFGGSGSSKADYNKSYSIYGNDLYGEIKYHVDGWSGGWDKYFYRVSSIDAPHNVVGDPLLAQALYDYDPEPLGWLFGEDAVYSGDSVTEILLPMCSGDDNYVSYVYDSENDMYLRFMNGQEFISAETGEQVIVKNIIVQYSTYKSVEGIKLWNMVGGGDADIYIGGKLIQGTWEKTSAGDATVYYDEEGKQIVLRPGNTWIHIHPEV
ncbi:MAG: DUF3048 domain-containing protein [Eubacteriales bacterium]|nr:DUF3048 domain-containing protein [Eubacteriales bacterium]